ncbi:MAG: hypothetical protein M3275_15375 [Thermoproteota archaeon]|nr:hypothetical protein [Thermoproteota archaeon]
MLGTISRHLYFVSGRGEGGTPSSTTIEEESLPIDDTGGGGEEYAS